MIIDIKKIMAMIPHRYPFLLVDKVIEINKGHSAVGVKNVTINEPHFIGHFPNNPIMPGVLIIEAMAQLSAILVAESVSADSGYEDKDVFFMAIESAKFRRIVVPGDVIKLYSTIEQNRANVWKFSAKAEVDGNLVTESKFTAMVKNKE